MAARRCSIVDASSEENVLWLAWFRIQTRLRKNVLVSSKNIVLCSHRASDGTAKVPANRAAKLTKLSLAQARPFSCDFQNARGRRCELRLLGSCSYVGSLVRWLFLRQYIPPRPPTWTTKIGTISAFIMRVNRVCKNKLLFTCLRVVTNISNNFTRKLPFSMHHVAIRHTVPS